MKKLIVLSGNSLRNKDWGEECLEYFSPYFDDAYMQYYDHWENSEPVLNFETEIEKLRDAIVGDESGTQYVVFAKSIGTLLLFESVAAKVFTPETAVLFGMPLDLAAEGIYKDDWSHFQTYTVPSLAFHNDQDPTANYEYARNAVGEHGENIVFTGLVGDNHDYLNFEEYEDTIKHFFSAQKQ